MRHQNIEIRFLTGNYATEAALKKAYHQLAKKFHTDNGGNLEDIQQLNAEYDLLRQKFEAAKKAAAQQEAAKKRAEERAKKRAEQEAAKKAKKPRMSTKQKVWEDLLHRFEGKSVEKFTWYGYNCFRWNNAVFVATGKGVDIYFEDEATCAKAIEAAKKHWFWSHSDYRKCVCWVKALKNEALEEVLKALAA